MPFKLPSPLEKVEYSVLKNRGIELYVKRDDLIHPEVSGNKWRKLRYNFEKAIQRGNRTVVTLGGAFSNHIAATAAAGAAAGLHTIGIIRGEDADLDNPTLSFARSKGMEIHTVSRSEYREEGSRDFADMLKRRFGSFYFIPSGGANDLGVMGCADILKEIDFSPDRIFTACGTGTTVSGIGIANAGKAEVYGISALKGGGFLRDTVAKNLKVFFNDAETEDFISTKIHILTKHHFGGYARIQPELIDFMRDFFRETGIKTDPVYTAKAAFAMIDFAKRHPPEKEEKWVFIHTGGMQGLAPMEAKSGISVYGNC